MKRKMLISMSSMHIGGAERSLIGLLESLDYKKYDVDLFLYRHEGEFMGLIPKDVKLLPPVAEYAALEKPIKQVFREGRLYLGLARIASKLVAKLKTRGMPKERRTYRQMQYTWTFALPKLPKLGGTYDAALSFLGPHYFILDKVQAAVKLGWNHTDYFTVVHPDRKLDEAMWERLDYIVNVSKDAEASFHKVFPRLRSRTTVVENILSPEFVKARAEEDVRDEMPEDGSLTICSVGRFSEAKGFDLAILACKELVDSGHDLKWYVVGYGGEEIELRRIIDRCGVGERFILLGKKANPYPYMKRCDIYCQPSRYEGKAVTVREAQMLGKPVVITSFPTAGSQLRDGVDGHICPLSVEGIRDGISKLYHDPMLRQKLSNQCMKTDYGNRSEVARVEAMVTSAENCRKEVAI